MFTLVLGIIGVCGFALLSLRHPKLRILEKAHPHAPRISIVIPARNEEKNLLHLLESITHQTLQPYEVIVVDDASTDRTREVAESFGVFVADTQRFDAMPKPVALHSGYLQTRGDVIVFLDADVVLDPAFVSSLSHHFARHSSGCITLQPTHNCSSIVDQLSHFFHISSITGSGLLSVWPFTIGLFGPCIALTRDVYESTGGFGNLDVASSVIEDVELAHVLTSMNVTTHRYMGTGLISYRMYTSLFAAISGWRKNIARGAQTSSRVVSIVLIAYFGFLLAAPREIIQSFSLELLIVYVVALGLLALASLKLGRYGAAVVLYPLTLCFFFFVFLLSAIDLLLKRNVKWKDRKLSM